MIDVCGYALDKKATTKRFFDICDFYKIKNKDFVKLFNVSNTTVSYWRNGTRFPDWDKFMLFAYTVELPLNVVIIGKKCLSDKQMEDAIKKINKLKEEKYISILKNILENKKLNSPLIKNEILFNPLLENIDLIEPAINLHDNNDINENRNILSNFNNYSKINSSSLYLHLNKKKKLSQMNMGIP